MSAYSSSTGFNPDHDDIASRLGRTLACFDQLPDSALIDLQTTSMVIHRSVASLWRDVKAGLLPLIYVGPKSPRVQVGTVRALIKRGARDVG